MTHILRYIYSCVLGSLGYNLTKLGNFLTECSNEVFPDTDYSITITYKETGE